MGTERTGLGLIQTADAAATNSVTASRPLDEVTLTHELQGSEGLDANYLSTIRTRYLFTQHQSLIAQMQFADAKAAALMALLGILALRGPFAIEEHLGSDSLRLLFLIACGASISCCLWAIFPRYPSVKQREQLARLEHWSWPALAAAGNQPPGYGDVIQTSEVSQLVHSVATANCSLSKILLAKFRAMRFAFALALAALLIVGAKLAT